MGEFKKKYFEGFNYLRVFASFSVVWIHVSFTNIFLTKWNLNGFSVPSFIMISIFLLGFKQNKAILFNLKSLLRRILPQYFFWTFVYLSLRFLKAHFTGELFNIGYKEFLLGGSSVQLWFLPALFIWQAFMLLLYKYSNLLCDVIICLSLFILGSYYNYIYKGDWWFLNFFVFNSGYILIGKIVFDNLPKLLIIKRWVFLINMILLAFLILLFTYLEKSLFDILIIHILFAISVFIYFTINNFKYNKYINMLARYSFGIYLSHFLFYQLIYTTQVYLKIEIDFFVTFLNIVATYILSLLFCIVLARNRYLAKVI